MAKLNELKDPEWVEIERSLRPVIKRTLRASPLKLDELAAAMGVDSPALLSNAASSSRMGQNPLYLSRAVALMRKTGDTGIARAVASLMGGRFVQSSRDPMPVEDVKDAGLRVAMALGQLSARILEATRDGVVDLTEWRLILDAADLVDQELADIEAAGWAATRHDGGAERPKRHDATTADGSVVTATE